MTCGVLMNGRGILINECFFYFQSWLTYLEKRQGFLEIFGGWDRELAGSSGAILERERERERALM